MEIDVIVSPPNDVGNWTNEDIAAIFSTLIIQDLLANDLTPARAFALGRRCGHYGLLALEAGTERHAQIAPAVRDIVNKFSTPTGGGL